MKIKIKEIKGYLIVAQGRRRRGGAGVRRAASCAHRRRSSHRGGCQASSKLEATLGPVVTGPWAEVQDKADIESRKALLL
jgi:hypothetical protein